MSSGVAQEKHRQSFTYATHVAGQSLRGNGGMITMGQTNRGPLGSDINQPTIDKGTNSRSENRPARTAGANDPGSISAVPISPIEAQWNRTKDWFSEMDDALG